ncbi:MAG: hypothetical protein HYX78_05755 [Armatimonadetes bacterium]|nr:hypothetical protein [Armatimonadota bacterium]
MKKVAVERLSKAIRAEVMNAAEEPVLLTARGEPVLVIRNLLEDDLADELIAQNPEFQASIQRAREQKAAGKTKSLAEMRERTYQ